MSDYLDVEINLSASSVTAINVVDSTPSTSDSSLYTQGTSFGGKMTKVDDTPYIPPDKITVRKYRLYKSKEA